jgi:hypothetical protein
VTLLYLHGIVNSLALTEVFAGSSNNAFAGTAFYKEPGNSHAATFYASVKQWSIIGAYGHHHGRALRIVCIGERGEKRRGIALCYSESLLP